METISALLAAGAAFGLSYLIGRSLTASTLLVTLGGLASGLGFAILFFVLTVTWSAPLVLDKIRRQF